MGGWARLAARLRGQAGGINVTIGSAGAVVLTVVAVAAGAAVIPTVTGGSGTDCTQSTDNVPDGPDPWGGCFPGPSNTGPTTAEDDLTAYTGPCEISTDNVTITGKVIDCDIFLTGSNLQISDSLLNGKLYNDADPDHTFTLTDVKVDSLGADGYATTDGGVGTAGFTLTRVEVLNSNRGAWCEHGCTITDSYFHGQNTMEPAVDNLAHASGVRAEQNSNLQHNSIACDYTGPFVNSDIGCSADVTGYPQFAVVYHNTFNKNLIVQTNGVADYCVFGGFSGGPFRDDTDNATYQVWTDNVFQKGANGKCGVSGPATDFVEPTPPGKTGSEWSGNVFDDGTAFPDPNAFF